MRATTAANPAECESHGHCNTGVGMGKCSRRIALWLAAMMLLLNAAASAQPAIGTTGGFEYFQPFIEPVLDDKLVPSGVVTSIAFDTSGLMWLGTQAGLLRFDGYDAKVITHDAADPHSIAGNYVRCLLVDAPWQLWLGTQSDGVSVLDTRTLQATHYRHEPDNPASIGKGTVFALARDRDGTIYIGSDDGLSYRLPNASGFTHARNDPLLVGSLMDDRVRAVLVTQAQDLYVGTAAGLALRRAGSADFVAVDAEPTDPTSLARKEIRSLFETDDGSLWIGTREHGAAVLRPGSDRVNWVASDGEKLPHNWVYTIAAPNAHEIWLGTAGGGIAVIDRASLKLMRVIGKPADGVGQQGLVSALAQDASGLLWIGTWGGGLSRAQAAQTAFRMLRAPTLSEQNVHSLLELRDGRLLVGTFSNGIDVLDRQRGLIGGYRPGDGPDQLPRGIVTALAETPDAAIWAGTQQGGVLRFAREKSGWQRFDLAAGLPSNQVQSLLVSASGQLWAGTAAGLARLDAAGSRFERVRDAAGTLHTARVVRIAEDALGRLWLATDDGLDRFDPASLQFAHARHETSRADSLASDDVNGVLIARSGALYADTAEGLMRLLAEHDGRFSFENVSSLAGLRDQTVGGNLREDATGRIWTEGYVFDPVSVQLHAIGPPDGIDLGTRWTGSSAITRDGLLLFGGTGGIAVVDPKHFAPWSYQPQVVLTDLRIDGVATPVAPQAQQLTLQPDQHNFSVTFAALDGSDPDKNLYSYRLEEVDADWIETTASHRIASYGNLWPGQYTLALRASNRNGTYSPHLRKISISVLPRYWQTPAFALVCLLLLVALLVTGHRWKLRGVVARARALEEQVTARTADLMHAKHELEEKNASIEAAYAQVAKAALTDPLTGLGNRRAITLAAPSPSEFAATGKLCACILVDLDRFKSINDQYGHAIGDRVLCATANALRANARAHDVLVRWGGEEFLVIAAVTSMSDAWQCAEHLRSAVQATRVAVSDTTSLAFTCSIGVSLYPFDRAHPARLPFETVLELADAGLYRAKHRGRNCCVGFECTHALTAEFETLLRQDPDQLLRSGTVREWATHD